MTLSADTEDTEPTDRHRVIASALLVGGSADFVARCRDTLNRVGVTLWNCGLEAYSVLAARRRPPIIFVLDSLFASDPVTVSEVAIALGSRVVRIKGEQMQQSDLDTLLVRAVFAAAGDTA